LKQKASRKQGDGMMKVKSLLLVLCMVLFLGSTARAENSAKIGFVDFYRALSEVNEGKKVLAQLEKEGKEKQQKMELKQKDLEAAGKDLEKQRLILSQDAFLKKQSEVQKKYMEFQKMGVEFENEFSTRRAELSKPLGDKLKTVIEEYGQKEKYTAILPKETMLYGPSGTDITDTIIELYNKKK